MAEQRDSNSPVDDAADNPLETSGSSDIAGLGAENPFANVDVAEGHDSDSPTSANLAASALSGSNLMLDLGLQSSSPDSPKASDDDEAVPTQRYSDFVGLSGSFAVGPWDDLEREDRESEAVDGEALLAAEPRVDTSLNAIDGSLESLQRAIMERVDDLTHSFRWFEKAICWAGSAIALIAAIVTIWDPVSDLWKNYDEIVLVTNTGWRNDWEIALAVKEALVSSDNGRSNNSEIPNETWERLGERLKAIWEDRDDDRKPLTTNLTDLIKKIRDEIADGKLESFDVTGDKPFKYCVARMCKWNVDPKNWRPSNRLIFDVLDSGNVAHSVQLLSTGFGDGGTFDFAKSLRRDRRIRIVEVPQELPSGGKIWTPLIDSLSERWTKLLIVEANSTDAAELANAIRSKGSLSSIPTVYCGPTAHQLQKNERECRGGNVCFLDGGDKDQAKGIAEAATTFLGEHEIVPASIVVLWDHDNQVYSRPLAKEIVRLLEEESKMDSSQDPKLDVVERGVGSVVIDGVTIDNGFDSVAASIKASNPHVLVYVGTSKDSLRGVMQLFNSFECSHQKRLLLVSDGINVTKLKELVKDGLECLKNSGWEVRRSEGFPCSENNCDVCESSDGPHSEGGVCLQAMEWLAFERASFEELFLEKSARSFQVESFAPEVP